MRRAGPHTKLSAIAAAATAVLLVVVLTGSSGASGAADAARAGSGVGGVKLTDLGDFDQPVYTATAPGKASRKLIFVVEQGGAIRVIRKGKTLAAPFLDVSDRIATSYEQGLLSIAFPPDYEKTRRFYIYFTASDGAITVMQGRTSANSPALAGPTLREVISIPHPAGNHNGGQVSFGPDGNLWLGTGDGGGACDPNENALNTESLLGKLLRIIPGKRGGYTIPKDNPFAKGAGADEVYSYGLRNPFRFSFDEKSKTISIGDVGQGAVEEIDHETIKGAKGANFGWDAYEGANPFVSPCGGDPASPPMPGTQPPIFEYRHSGGEFNGCSVTGGLIVRDKRLKSLAGRYLYSDVCNGELRSIVPALSGGTGDVALGLDVNAPTSFVADRKGRVYVTAISGDVFRLDPAGQRTRSAPAARKPGDGKGGFRAAKIGSFNSPTYVIGPEGAGGLVFVVEQGGTIRQFKGGKVIGGTFLDISKKVQSGGEQGLLSMAFPPDYGTSGLFYVYYTEDGGDIVVEEYQRAGSNQRKADAGSARTVIKVEHSQNSNHNGGQLQFGPDGNLYIGTGDGGSGGDPPENAQDKGSLLGKLLRIDPRRNGNDPYSIPNGNPFTDGSGANEIYSYGLRNPYRFSFDSRSGDLTIGDVGEGRTEEVDIETLDGARGANFGWDAFEGKKPFQSSDASPTQGINHTPPVFEYGRGGGGCTVIGGYVSRDQRIKSLFGRYLYADLCIGQIRSFVPSGNDAKGDRKTGLNLSGIATFGQDTRGGLYYASVGNGDVMAIRPKKGKK